MVFALSVLIAAGQAAGPPAGLASSSPDERLVTVRALFKQPVDEVRGVWLFDAVLDADQKIAIEVMRQWPAYEPQFEDELGDAIQEAQLDGAPLQRPAKTVREWQTKVAERLTKLALSNDPSISTEAFRSLVRLTLSSNLFEDEFRLSYEINNSYRDSETAFDTALKSIVEAQPQRAIGYIKANGPQDAAALILTLQSDMPADADNTYAQFLKSKDARWQRVGITGYSYRPKPVRLKALYGYLSSPDLTVRQDAVKGVGFNNNDWAEFATDRKNWPTAAKALASTAPIWADWSAEFVNYLFDHPDPLVQAAGMSQVAIPSSYPERLPMVMKRFRSNVPELRKACVGALWGFDKSTYLRCMEEALQDKSKMVLETAFFYAMGEQRFARLLTEIFASGVGETYSMDARFDLPENAQLFAECLTSRNERKRLLAASYLVGQQPEDAVAIFKTLVSSQDAGMRYEALMGLSVCGKPGAEAMVVLLDPGNQRLFSQISSMMQSEYRHLAVPVVKRYVKHANRKIRIACKEFLRPDY